MPYSIGLHSATEAFLSTGFPPQLTIALVAFLLIIFLTSAFEKDSVHEPDYLPGFTLFHINSFFRQRYDFLNWGFYATGQKIFQFKLLQVIPVIPRSSKCLPYTVA